MYNGNYSLLNDIKNWCSCSDVPRGCVNRILLWPLRRDAHSDVLISAGGSGALIGLPTCWLMT